MLLCWYVCVDTVVLRLLCWDCRVGNVMLRLLCSGCYVDIVVLGGWCWDCNVEVVKIISHQYASRFGDSSDTSPCVAGKRVTEGINSSEVITHSVHTKSQGLFEKMFTFFS